MHQPEVHWALFRKGVLSALYDSSGMIRRVLRDVGARVAQSNASSAGGHVQTQKVLRFLDQHHEVWVRQYPAYLLMAFSEVVDFDLAQQEEDIISDLGSIDAVSDLSLKAKSELMHVNRTLEAAVEVQLESLDGLVSAARGYSYARRTRNPMRPENYIQAMQKMLFATRGSDDTIGTALLKQFAASIAVTLARTYSLVITQLSEGGIEPVQKRTTAFGAMTTGYGNLSFMDKAKEEQTERRLTKEELIQALGDEAPSFVLTGHAPDPITVSGAALHRKAAAPQLKEQGHHESSGQTLNFKSLLLDVVKDVARLQPIKESIASLQPTLRELVQTDPAFLRDAQHPARLFLKQIKRQARRFDTEQSLGFLAFDTNLREAIAANSLTKVASAQAFEAANAQLQVTTVDEPAASVEKHSVDSAVAGAPPILMIGKINPEVLLQQVIVLIQAAPLFPSAHARVQTFVAGPWAKVVSKSLLRHLKTNPSETAPNIDTLIALDPKGYMALVPVLLGSVQAQQLKQPDSDFLRAIKSMYDTIRTGLLGVGLEADKVNAVVVKLKELHRQALQEASAEHTSLQGVELLYQSPRGGPIDIGAVSFEAAAGATESTSAKAAPRMQLPRLTLVSDDGDLPSDDVVSPVDSSAENGKKELPDLPVGCWLAIGEGDQQQQSQLSWASPDQSVFMFTSADGSNHTMTRRRLLAMYQQGEIRLIDPL